MVAFSNLLTALHDVPDPRRAQGKRYPLPHLLLFTVLALLSGAQSYSGIITFLQQRREFLNRHFGVDLKRAPVVNTLRTLLQSLDTEDLEAAFRRHAKALLPEGTSSGAAGETPVIALDGKMLRGSFDHLNDRKAAQTLTAFASEPAIVLAHTDIADKSNEIPAAEQMIRDLGLTGVVFTADAMRRCHALSKKTFEAARDTGNFLIAQVKANQPTLHDRLAAICHAEPPTDSAETAQRGRHGRQEHRLVETFDVAGRLGAEWDGLIVAAARVTRLTWHKDTKTGLWRQTGETSIYACQIGLPATAAGAAIRQHWGIENRSHYVRDVSFFEDRSRIRTKPGHFARFRSFALNVLRANGTTNVSQELYINALNPNHALSYRLA